MSPKSTEQFNEIRNKSRQNIKDVALELFASNGYHNTSVSRIAKEANISKGLLYNYFENKEALLLDIINDALIFKEENFINVLKADKPAPEILADFLNRIVDEVETHVQYWKLLTAISFQGEVQAILRPMFEEKMAEYMPVGINLFAKLGYENPWQEMLLFSASLDGILLQYMNMPPEMYPLEEMINLLLNKYIKDV